MKKLLTLREIQLEELKILEEVADFIEKHNLKYTLNGGTLLGAIRHKGFIPWDDDIDISMPRPDYEKFIQLFLEENKNENLILCCPENKKLAIPFCKIKNKRIAVEDDGSKAMKEQGYLWIDIFPVDGLPKDEKECQKIYKKKKFYNNFMYVHNNKSYFKKKEDFFKDIVKLICKPISLFYSADTVTKLAKKIDYDRATYAGKIVSGYGLKERMLKKEFEEYVDVDFEGKKFKAIKNYDKYLKQCFKNYMQLPPESKRATHHLTAWKVVDGKENK